jgi:hypothetical protein
MLCDVDGNKKFRNMEKLISVLLICWVLLALNKDIVCALACNKIIYLTQEAVGKADIMKPNFSMFRNF